MDKTRTNPVLLTHKAQKLIRRIESIAPDFRRVEAFPPEWELDARTMIALVDAGYLGMDGFKYQFREYAQQCWRTCHRSVGKF